MAMPWGFADLLDRKYAILQQQADATTRNAETGAITGQAAATLDATRAKLLPGESAANIGLTRAQTDLTATRNRLAPGESAAGNTLSLAQAGLARANTSLTNTQNQVSRYEGLGDLDGLSPAVRSAIEAQRQRFRLSDPLLGR